jgi:dephospho-CoA kinase
VIGLTGGLGTGKTTVARMFRALGAAVIDADRLAHRALGRGQPAAAWAKQRLGAGALKPDGSVDRRALAAAVFADPATRRSLERLVHPQVLRDTRARIRLLRKSGRAKVVVLDVPLLFEAKMDRLADQTVVVFARPAIQRQRLLRDGWTAHDIAARTAAQWNLSAKVALADHVVDNSGRVEHTRGQVRRIWKRLQAASRPSSTSQRSKS